jgi:hypothetical protein
MLMLDTHFPLWTKFHSNLYPILLHDHGVFSKRLVIMAAFRVDTRSLVIMAVLFSSGNHVSAEGTLLY